MISSLTRNNGATIWIKKLWSRYRHTVGKISYQEPMGRPCNGLADHKEHSAIFSIRHKQRNGAVSLEKSIEFQTEIHILHNTIHRILIDKDLTSKQSKKSK